MKNILLLLVLICSVTLYSQNKSAYLRQNRYDLHKPEFVFPQNDFNIIGYGAYHGSAKTYDAEMLIIKSLKKQNALDYYISETNFSQAFYFQKFLETGDEELLKELVLAFQTIVGQEGTIETFEHWKKLRALNQLYPDNPITVIGFDVINEYKFSIKHLLHLVSDIQNWKLKDELIKISSSDNYDFSIENEETTQLLKRFINDYELNKSTYTHQLKDSIGFHHILKNINYTLQEHRDREKIIFENYIYFNKLYELSTKKQFAKYGFFHLQKEREGEYPSFFTRLIEEGIYNRNQVITVMGYLINSKVLWDKVYNQKGGYQNYTIEKGYGIGDYWKEYFKGIRNLKRNKLSDLTLFKLNAFNSPYRKGVDLIEVKLLLREGNKKELKGKATTDFIDYAVLIDNSENQIPIEEM